MGSNKRYADAIDRRQDARILERSMHEERPLGLTMLEVDLDRFPLTTTRQPIAARAWVHYPSVVSKLDVRVIAWTSRAVQIEWDVPSGKHGVWVWANAVERV